MVARWSSDMCCLPRTQETASDLTMASRHVTSDVVLATVVAGSPQPSTGLAGMTLARAVQPKTLQVAPIQATAVQMPAEMMESGTKRCKREVTPRAHKLDRQALKSFEPQLPLANMLNSPSCFSDSSPHDSACRLARKRTSCEISVGSILSPSLRLFALLPSAPECCWCRAIRISHR